MPTNLLGGLKWTPFDGTVVIKPESLPPTGESVGSRAGRLTPRSRSRIRHPSGICAKVARGNRVETSFFKKNTTESLRKNIEDRKQKEIYRLKCAHGWSEFEYASYVLIKTEQKLTLCSGQQVLAARRIAEHLAGTGTCVEAAQIVKSIDEYLTSIFG